MPSFKQVIGAVTAAVASAADITIEGRGQEVRFYIKDNTFFVSTPWNAKDVPMQHINYINSLKLVDIPNLNDFTSISTLPKLHTLNLEELKNPNFNKEQMDSLKELLPNTKIIPPITTQTTQQFSKTIKGTYAATLATNRFNKQHEL